MSVVVLTVIINNRVLILMNAGFKEIQRLPLSQTALYYIQTYTSTVQIIIHTLPCNNDHDGISNMALY